MTEFNAPPPDYSPDELQHIAMEYFGVSGTAVTLASERDQNAKISADEQTILLKISNANEEPAYIELQDAALSHLARTDPALPVPRRIAPADPEQHSGLIRHTKADQTHVVRALTFLPGRLLSDERPDLAGLASIGALVGQLSAALQGFFHPAAVRPEFLWNLDNAASCRPFVSDVTDPAYQHLLSEIFDQYDAETKPRLANLRQAIIHQDANDANILVDTNDGTQITGLVDFGDMVFGRQINELAVAVAYALMDQRDLYAAAHTIISAYCNHFTLQEDELDVLFDLVKMRLAMSVCISSHRSKDYPDNEYLLVSQRPALKLLKRLHAINREFARAVFRNAAGLPPVSTAPAITEWLQSDECQPVSLFAFNIRTEPRMMVPMHADADGIELKSDPDQWWTWLKKKMTANGALYSIGLYGEVRDVYKSDAFASEATNERRTQHLGMDFFLDPGTTVRAPLAGVVETVVNNSEHLSYGPTVVLRHQAGKNGPTFYTLYGHLSLETLGMVSAGQQVVAGETIGTIGNSKVNVGWAPHLHFQIITAEVTQLSNFHGVGEPGQWDIWQQISPDPNLICRLSEVSFDAAQTTPSELLSRRAERLGPSLSLSYSSKLKIVDGYKSWLVDQSGREYLDCVNNIAHVGHCHPHVVSALCTQAGRLNTNTRYLHDGILDYADRLTATLPEPLRVAYFVNSGSEANELALRIARTVTGLKDTIVLDWGYHGNTSSLIEISPYKFNRRGGFPQPAFVEIADIPDPYRGAHKGYDAASGQAYAQSVVDCIQRIKLQNGRGPAAFIAESISGVGGQVIFPDGYLQTAYEAVRAAGGLCIADEVQCGFGRVGNHYWAFEDQDVVPDIVVLGKPMGNGHPMAAVITTKDIADRFANGMEYFNSFGGNPVSAAVGMAVMDVIEDENLMSNAQQTGEFLLKEWRGLMHSQPLIGDVRGTGLFLGIELVESRETLKPADEKAGKLVNLLRDDGILLSTDGPFENVIKFKPPMVFGQAEAELLTEKLERAFTRLPLAV